MKKLVVTVVIITCIVVIAAAVTSTYLIGRHTANEEQQQKQARAMRIAREYAAAVERSTQAWKEFERLKQKPGSEPYWNSEIAKMDTLSKETSRLYEEAKNIGILKEPSPYPEALELMVRAVDKAVSERKWSN